MDVLELETIRRVIAAAEDRRNPSTQAAALAKLDQWRVEIEVGTLTTSEEGEQLLPMTGKS